MELMRQLATACFGMITKYEYMGVSGSKVMA